MASACVNNVAMSPDSFLDCPPTTYPTCGWLSPRMSINREFSHDDPSKTGGSKSSTPAEKSADPPEVSDPEPSVSDFEFCLEDPVTMLPADKLFSDGKLVPLHLSAVKLSVTEEASIDTRPQVETDKSRRSIEIDGTGPYLFSPKAPRCSSRWRELLGLKKLNNANANKKTESQKTTSSLSSSSTNTAKSLKIFLHRSSKSSSSSSESSLSLPLLKDSDCESVAISSSRLSLSSSSSSCHELDDLARVSLDSEKINPNPISLLRNPNPPKIRMARARAASMSSDNNQRSLMDQHTAVRNGRSPLHRAPEELGGVDSPRMNSSGKIVFHSLERSSSSPSTFNAGPHYKHRGMERSYSANVRVTPFLNVPVCSLRGSSKSGSVFGFGSLFLQPKREGNGSAGSNRSHGSGNPSNSNGNGRHRTDRN